MKPQHALVVLLAMLLASGLASVGSYRSASRMVSHDMARALAITMQEQHSDVISQDTIRAFNSHLQIAELRGRATLAVDTRSRQFRAYAHCSEATIFSLSDQRPAALLWVLTAFWAMFAWHRRRATAAVPATAGPSLGGLTYSAAEGRFYAADGSLVRFTPMQHQLLEMFFLSPSHSLSKAEICDALWPKKPDASETLYTLIRRLKPIVEHYSDLKIESDRSKAYRLTNKQIEN